MMQEMMQGTFRPPLPPGLSLSDGETSTVSRERRRVAMAAREVVGAITEHITKRFEGIENKLKIIIDAIAGHDVLRRIDRLETLFVCTDPSVDDVLEQVL